MIITSNLYSTYVSSGSFLSKSAAKSVIFLAQVQLTLMILETYLNQLSSQTIAFERFFDSIMQITNFSRLQFVKDKELFNIRFMLITIFLLFQLFGLIISVAFGVKLANKGIAKFISTIGQIHLYIGWLPCFNFCLRIVLDGVAYGNIKASMGVKVGICGFYLFLNFIFLTVNLIFYPILKGNGAFSRIDNPFLICRLIQLSLTSALNLIHFISNKSETLILTTILLTLFFEFLTRYLLYKTIPFYKFKLNKLFSSLGLMATLVSILSFIYFITRSENKVSWNYNIFLGAAVFFLLAIKIDQSLLENIRREIVDFSDLKAWNFKSNWSLQRLVYLERLWMNSKRGKKGVGFHMLHRGFVYGRAKLEFGVEIGDEEKNFSARQLVESLRKVAMYTKRVEIKVMLVQLMISDQNYMLECAILIEKILLSPLPLSTRLSLLELRLTLQNSVQSLSHHFTESIDLDYLILFNNTHEKLKSYIFELISYSQTIFSFFESNKPNFANLVDCLKSYRLLEAELEQYWSTKCTPMLRRCNVLHVEYALYCNILKMDWEGYAKNMSQYSKQFNECYVNFKEEAIVKKTILDPMNIIVFVHAEIEKLGTISSITSNVRRIFGQSQEFLEGKDIDTLMPQYIQGIHGEILRKKLSSSEELMKYQQISGYIIDGARFLRRTHVLASVLPDLENGIKLIGIIRPFKVNQRVIIIDERGTIQAFTKEFAREFDLNPHKEYSLHKLSPGLLDSLKVANSMVVNDDEGNGCYKVENIEHKRIHNKVLDFYGEDEEDPLSFACTFTRIKVKGKHVVYTVTLGLPEELGRTKLRLTNNKDSDEFSACDERSDNEVKTVQQRKSGRRRTTRTRLMMENSNSEDFDEESFKRSNKSKSRISGVTNKTNKSGFEIKSFTMTLNNHSTFYRASDTKATIGILALPFITFLFSLLFVYFYSSNNINKIKTALEIDFQITSLDKALDYLSTIVVTISNGGLISPADRLSYLNQATAIIKQVKIETSNSLVDLSTETQDLFFKKLNIYNPLYTVNLTQFNHHKGTYLSLVDELLNTATFVLKYYNTTRVTALRYNTAVSFALTNFNNDIIFRRNEIKTALTNSVLDLIDTTENQATLQMIISSIVFVIAVVVFVIGSIKSHMTNKNFLQVLFFGDYSEDITEQKNKLTSFQQALLSHNFTKVEEEDYEAPALISSKGKGDKKGLAKTAFKKTISLETRATINSSAFVIILLINFILVLLGCSSLKDQMTYIPPKVGDLSQLSKINNELRNFFNNIRIYIRNKTTFIEYKNIRTALAADLTVLASEIYSTSQLFTFDFQTRLYKDMCPSLNETTCRVILQGVATKGVAPAMINSIDFFQSTFVGLNNRTFPSPAYVAFVNGVGFEKYFVLVTKIISPYLDLMLKTLSGEIIDLADSGLEQVIGYIITGVIVSILFRLCTVLILLPKSMNLRRDIYRVLLMIPMKSLLNNRLMKEFLIKDSKELYGIIKRGADKEANFTKASAKNLKQKKKIKLGKNKNM